MRRTFYLAMLIFVIVISYTAWLTLNKAFLEQSRIQQESVSPVFSLIVDELLRPLHIAETTYKSGEFVPFFNHVQPDEELLVKTLKEYEETFDLVFFAASEKARKQYLSNGKQIDLIAGEVSWYFQALEDERDFLADLGDVDDVHLFFDFKVYNDSKEFLGIVGVGKSMQRFLAEFENYKSRHGYDFMFVDEQDRILLSSRENLLTAEGNLTQLNSLPWYNQISNRNAGSLDGESLDRGTLNSILIEEAGKSFLLSEVRLQSLNWRVILLLPLENKQNQLTQIFLNNLLTILLVIVFFTLFVLGLTRYLGAKISKHVDIDHLSQLPNRRFVENRFNKLREQNAKLSFIVVDIDHFKSINDNYGHNVGDIVIQETSKILQTDIRTNDIAARWGGEEFVLVLPGASFKTAIDIAERLRVILAKTDMYIEGEKLHITASFGVTYSEGDHDLIDLVEVADDLLYQAKREGRNCVRAGLPPV